MIPRGLRTTPDRARAGAIPTRPYPARPDEADRAGSSAGIPAVRTQLDWRSRTSPQTTRRAQPHEDQDAQAVRLVAKVLRELLQQETFTDLSSVTEALKCRCARLKIRDYSRLVSRACALVGSNHPLVTAPPRAALVLPPAEPRPLSRREAAALWSELAARVGGALKTLPRVSSSIRIDATTTPDVDDLESLIGGGR